MTDALGARRLEVAGVGVSDGIARAVATADPRLVRVALDLPGYADPPPDLAPETSGAHLFRGWQWLREQFLARDRAPPESAGLTRMLLDLIDAREAHTVLEGALRADAGPVFRS